MEPRRRDLGTKRHVSLEELPVVRNEVLTDADLAAIISRVQGFLEEKGPSPEEELEQLLSDRQVRLVRAAWGTLAPFLTRIRGFYQAVEGDFTFVYYLGPEYEWLAPSSPPAADPQEQGSPAAADQQALPPSETLVPSGEDTAPQAKQVLRLSAEIESHNSQSDASGMHREWDEGFRRYQARPMDNAVGGDPLDLHDHSGPVADRHAQEQRSGGEEKENAPGVLLQPPGRGAVGGTSRKREGAEGGRVQRYWHGRPFRNRQNVPAASAAKGSHESVAKQPAVKPAAPKPSGPVTPPAKPRCHLPGGQPPRTESLKFHWNISDTGATSVRVESWEAKSSTCTPKSKAEAQIERVVMSVKKRVPERSESEIRRCVDELRLTRGGYSRMTLGEIVDEVLEHIKGAF